MIVRLVVKSNSLRAAQEIQNVPDLEALLRGLLFRMPGLEPFGFLVRGVDLAM